MRTGTGGTKPSADEPSAGRSNGALPYGFRAFKASLNNSGCQQPIASSAPKTNKQSAFVLHRAGSAPVPAGQQQSRLTHTLPHTSAPMKRHSVHIEELPYQPDSSGLFERIETLPCPLLLDSGHPHTRAGRFDIISADPLEEITLSSTNSTRYEDIQELFEKLSAVHSRHGKGLVPPAEDIPFCGGIAGYLDYELGQPLQYLPARAAARCRLYCYEWALLQDHLLQRCRFVALPSMTGARRRAVIERLQTPLPAGAADDFVLSQPFGSNMQRADYRAAFTKIQRYIRAGDCYQVNLARRFDSRYTGRPWRAFQTLRAVAGAHFAGYMDNGAEQLLCLSPERFLRLSGRRVETRPIKGTRARHSDAGADRQAAEALQRSSKDRAENLMIVDLLRNDIGRNCVPGSIQVERLFELESYPAVHHLVSTISGELLTQRSACELLRDSFPGGSITGAPKRRAMQIIAELEPAPRRAYCGSMLYISADGRMDSNIAIRSLLCERGEIHCWGGGAIVADSQWEQEYRENWDKISPLIETLEAHSGLR